MESPLPDSILGIRLSARDNAITANLPTALLKDIDLKLIHFGSPADIDCHAIVAPRRIPMKSIRALVSAIGANSSLPCVYFSPVIDNALKQALIKEGFPFIQDERNAFLPFLGLIASDAGSLEAPKELSPQAERIFINLLAGRWDGCTAGELARLTGKSAASVTKYLAELRAVCPGIVQARGKERVLVLPNAGKEELLSLFEPFLASPVKKIHRLAKMLAPETLASFGALVAGESALSYYSDLAADGSSLTVAMDSAAVGQLQKVIGDEWVDAAWFNPASLVIEEWPYSPDDSSNVSAPATGLAALAPEFLYTTFANSRDDDIRLGDAIAQLRSLICR